MKPGSVRQFFVLIAFEEPDQVKSTLQQFVIIHNSGVLCSAPFISSFHLFCAMVICSVDLRITSRLSHLAIENCCFYVVVDGTSLCVLFFDSLEEKDWGLRLVCGYGKTQ